MILRQLKILAALPVLIIPPTQGPVINEIMQSNINCYCYNWQYPDSWVEIYNPTDKAIDMTSYSINTVNDCSTAFPIRRKIAPHGFQVIQCDKNDAAISFSFKLESDTIGHLYLFNDQEQLIDSLTYPKMIGPNVAYGRFDDGAAYWGWELKPTPGLPNNGYLSYVVLPSPVFSRKSGILTAPTKVKVSMPPLDGLPDDTRLYVTTDGSIPTTESLTGNELEFNIEQSTVLRARLISSQALESMPVAHSYIFHPRETGMPILSVAGDPNDLYDSVMGMFSEKINFGTTPNYMKRNWRRPINVEILNTPFASFNQLCETAIAGHGSRGEHYPQKSLKFYADKRFGTKKFKGMLWDDKQHIRKVKSFTMRNGGNTYYSYRITDAFVQRLFGHNMDNLDWLSYQPAILYINGQYKGVFGLRERSDESFVEANYDGLEDIERFTSYNETTNYPLSCLKQLYSDPDITYRQLSEVIDVDNFIRTLIVECYAGNYDYPHNNISAWRSKEPGSKWRWIVKDLDYMQFRSPADFDMFNFIFLQGKEGTIFSEPSDLAAHQLYQVMLSMPEVIEPFIDLYAVSLGDFLQEAVSCSLIDEMAEEIVDEVADTWALYGTTRLGRRYFLETYIPRLKDFCRQRPQYVYRQITDHFNQGDVVEMTIAGSSGISINGIALTQDQFSGAWFSQRPLTLQAPPDSYGSQQGWCMRVTHPDGSQTLHYYPDSQITITLADDIGPCTAIHFETDDPTRVSSRLNPGNTQSSASTKHYDLQGRTIAPDAKGIVISKGNKSRN